ncbi:hypothetical protein C922_05806 [Plasmodium inui San Antonio 1]|uniref:Plasmodium RESA N-terminal domain-containing protein n=1 Tax=Plasmodium inui San Antonio 1 TaxID=1237626 RepID=W6ZWY7_9APIC|nr:hypothetical protein C922_05806 [Plasmodium inui San Antonio 1]EUD63813.1 hypothetical protein C922_05806 [Plasmodium inui San Antonio 1]
MSQIQGRNLSELNENGCFRRGNSDRNVNSPDSESDDNVLSAPDEVDLGENEEEDALDSDRIVEKKYEEKSDLCNIDSPRLDQAQVILTSDVTRAEVDQPMNNMEQVPSRNEIIKVWEDAYALEKRAVCKMVSALFKYYEELKERYRVKEELDVTHWNRVMSRYFDVLTKKEEHYNKLFNSFIMKDDLTKQEVVNFLNNCKKEVAELRKSLGTFAKKEFDARIIPKRGN